MQWLCVPLYINGQLFQKFNIHVNTVKQFHENFSMKTILLLRNDLSWLRWCTIFFSKFSINAVMYFSVTQYFTGKNIFISFPSLFFITLSFAFRKICWDWNSLKGTSMLPMPTEVCHLNVTSLPAIAPIFENVIAKVPSCLQCKPTIFVFAVHFNSHPSILKGDDGM